jgi:hypothetical protein
MRYLSAERRNGHVGSKAIRAAVAEARRDDYVDSICPRTQGRRLAKVSLEVDRRAGDVGCGYMVVWVRGRSRARGRGLLGFVHFKMLEEVVVSVKELFAACVRALEGYVTMLALSLSREKSQTDASRKCGSI